MNKILVNLIKSVDEIFELKFIKFEGEILPCTKYLKKYFELSSNNDANQILKDKRTLCIQGTYFECMTHIGFLQENNIYFDLIQITQSPWEDYSDDEIEKLLFFEGWRNLSLELKKKWLDSIRLLYFKYPCQGYRSFVDTSTKIYELDGRKIVDYPSFFIALGQAVNGFGGYFGGSLDALEDCLRGGFGTPKYFMIKWYHSNESKKNLDEEDSEYNLFDEIQDILADNVEML